MAETEEEIVWVSRPFVFLFFMLSLAYYFIFVYFNTEIITRTDFKLKEKTKWQIINTVPFLGSALYATCGNRHLATFP